MTLSGEFFFSQRHRKYKSNLTPIEVFDVFILNNLYYHSTPYATFYRKTHAEEYVKFKNAERLKNI